MTIQRRNYGRGHAYYDTDNGQKIPGVTTILGDGLPKPALVGWAANTTAEYAVDHWDELTDLKPSERLKTLQKARYADRDAAANRGTAVHLLAEKLVAGHKVDVPDELAGHVDSYVRFLDDFDVQPIITEGVILNRSHRYAGTLDLICDIPTFKAGPLICDVKTSRSGVWPDNALQIAAYRYADVYLDADGTEKPLPEVAGAAVIHVRADGYDLVPIQAGPTEFRYFLYVMQLWRWANEHSKTVVGEPHLPPHLREDTA